MSNFTLSTPELSDIATITGSESLGDNGVSNLQKRSLARFWRSSDETNSFIELDFGSPVEIDQISLVSHNGTATGSVTITAGTTSAVSDYSSGALDLITGTDQGYSRNLFNFHLPSSETYRYWRIEIDDTGNPDGYFQAGRVYLSKAFQPEKNASYGIETGFLDNSRVSRTITGDGIPVVRTPLRTVKFNMDFSSEDEMFGTVYDIERLRGASKDVLFVFDPEATTHFQRRHVYGLFEELEPIINSAFGVFQKSFKITELP